MKKALCSLLIVAILMNFIISSICYAEEVGTSGVGGVFGSYKDGTENTSANPTNEAIISLTEDGKTSSTNGGGSNISTNSSMAGPSMIGVVMGYLALIIDIIPLQFQVILSLMTKTRVLSADGTEEFDFFLTIDRIVFNKVALFNANYFDTNDTYTVGTGDNQAKIYTKNTYTTDEISLFGHTIIDEHTIETQSPNKLIKENITKMFMVCRILAIIIGLLVLIYIGIRMAISTVAAEQAKYKHMLFSWVESIALMFVLVYIMIIIISIGDMLTDVFYNLRCDLLAVGEKNFETVICESLVGLLFDASGLKLAIYSIVYWILVFCQVRFFYLYMKRMLMIGFLIMISPLITITYSIDKVGDGKAQALTIWFQEFIVNVLIQPLHALIYLVFMFTAGKIAEYAPLLAVAFMLALGNVEKMVKIIFNIKDMTTLGGINDFLKKGKK